MSLYQSLAVIASLNGKRFACGTTDADGGADVDVVSGLNTVEYCGASLAGAPTINHSIAVAIPSSTAGSVNILGFKPTNADTATPTASTTEVAVTWWAVGD